ncbi:PAS domain-containing protein [Haloterrigena sp. H1]|nr:PAS domain-containing protein [Haloterrigena sp. H1]
MTESPQYTATALLNAAPDAVITVNEGGEITYANDRIRDLFGYEPRTSSATARATRAEGHPRDTRRPTRRVSGKSVAATDGRRPRAQGPPRRRIDDSRRCQSEPDRH